MKLIRYLFSGFMISLVSLIGFCSIAILGKGQKLIQFDQVLISSIQSFESPTLTLVMKIFTQIGSFPSVLVITLFVCLFTLFCLKASGRAYIIYYGYGWNAHDQSGSKTIFPSSSTRFPSID